MLKVLHVRLQQYMNRELPNVQATFGKDRGTRDQITNIRWIIEKAKEFHKTSTSGETMKTVRDFIFLGSKITADGDCRN